MKNLEILKEDLKSYQEQSKDGLRYMFSSESRVRKQQISQLIDANEKLISFSNQRINDNRTLSISFKELKKLIDTTKKIYVIKIVKIIEISQYSGIIKKNI